MYNADFLTSAFRPTLDETFSADAGISTAKVLTFLSIFYFAAVGFSTALVNI